MPGRIGPAQHGDGDRPGAADPRPGRAGARRVHDPGGRALSRPLGRGEPALLCRDQRRRGKRRRGVEVRRPVRPAQIDRRHAQRRDADARRVRAITVRILAQFRHDRRTLALLFVAPIVILGLLDFLLRGSGSHPAVGIVNLDQGGIGGNVATRLESSSLVSASPMDATAADRGLREGSLAGYVVFAADFSTRAVSEHVLAPQVHLEGSQPGPGQQVVAAVDQAVVAAISSLTAAGAPRLTPQVSYLYGGPGLDSLDYLGAALIGLVVFFLVFVITSVAFLR